MSTEMDKIDAAIGRQRKYLDQLNQRIAITDNRQFDAYTRLLHEQKNAENALEALQRAKAQLTPLGSSRGYFIGSQG
jgi:hypothetical protein